MGHSIARAHAPTHSHSVGASLDGLKAKALKVGLGWKDAPTRTNADAHKAAFGALVDEARIAAGLQPKEMYLAAETDKGSWSAAIAGKINLPAHWLMNQPDAWWIAFINIVTKKRGFDPVQKREASAQLIGRLVEALINHTVVSE